MNTLIVTNNIDKIVDSILKKTSGVEQFIFDNKAEDLRQVVQLHKTTIPCVVIVRNLQSDSILAVAENVRDNFDLYAVNLKLPDNLALQSRFKVEYQYDDFTQLAEVYIKTHKVTSDCHNLTFFFGLAHYIKDYDKLKQLQRLINYIQSAQTNILWQDIFRRLEKIV